MVQPSGSLLGPSDIRRFAEELSVRPTKTLGQNFLHDGNTIRRIVRTAQVGPDDTVLEVGPGLGSLTLGLLEAGCAVIAVEIDPVLAQRLPATVAEFQPAGVDRLRITVADALRLGAIDDPQPTALVANLPYNVAVPVLLTLLAAVPSLQHGLVMVQSEVADRLAAPPGSRTYGVPSAKAAWFASVTRAGSIARSVFWPVPNVDSGLVRFVRRAEPVTSAGVSRVDVFAVIDAAFSQRRKMLRSALAPWAGSAAEAERRLIAAGVDPTARGETLSVTQFAAIAAAAVAV